VLGDEGGGGFGPAAAQGGRLAAARGGGAGASLRGALGAAHAAPAPGLPTRGEPEDLGAAERALAALAQAAPELRTRARALSGALHAGRRALEPAPTGLTHGDLGIDQILVEADRVALT